jgi:peptide chain release factor subunit 1
MMQERDLQELAELVCDKATLLSLYLNVDPHRRSTDEYRLCLRQLLSQAVNQGAPSADVERIERYFNHEYNWQGKGVACFSGQADGFWRAYPLLVPVEDFVFLGRRPYLTPLTELWSEYERFGVVTVDREGARVFIYHLGAMEDSAGTMGTEVKRHKQGGRAAQRLQRHEDEEAKHNLKDAAAWADSYLRQHKVTRVVLSGSDANVAQFRELLPRSLGDKVVGNINLDMNASPAEVWEGAFEVAQSASQRTRADLLEQAITLAHKGGAGVIGLPDTLAALREGRVYSLLVDREFHCPGRLCPNCRAAVVEEIDRCPYCGSELSVTADLVQAALQQAVGSGLKVSMIDHDDLASRSGGIAAILRY